MSAAYPTAPPPYGVRLEGQGVTLRDTMVVRQIFLMLIEEALGPPERVVACFRAWSKEMAPENESLNDKELADARAWRQSCEQATAKAKTMLSSPRTVEFVFELAV
ncbi:hypothetical protein [Variovorax sp. E3]|uniref:hypothetical protein n=1 Tax=Variovorax sp. E3 TaxID=1914993 RepID=UPI0018DE6936|nr:hypothetical protein [Variovorax sp. E3]